MTRRPALRGRLQRLLGRKHSALAGFAHPAPAAPPSRPSTATGAFSRRRVLCAPVRVVTDIDDTVKSSGGLNIFGVSLGGIDKRLGRGMFYPGAVQFSFEVSAYGGPFVAYVEPASVAVLTARARELKFALALRPKGKLCSRYRATGVSSGHPQWGVEHVYYGSVVEWLFHHRKGIRKFQNFEKLAEADAAMGKKFQYLLIGDTGEKDEDAAERIVHKYPKQVKAIFLHAVAGVGTEDTPRDRVLNGVSFYYFRTYVGAAVKAFHHGLINREGLARVVEQSSKDMHIMASSPVTAFRIRMKRKYPLLKSEYENDIILAKKVLSKEYAVAQVIKSL